MRASLPSDAELDEAATLFAALSDRTRLKLLHALRSGEELCVCDVAHVLGISVSAASHHLRKLRDLKILAYRNDGKMAYYSLRAALEAAEPARTELADALAQARDAFVPKRYDCLGCAVCYPAIAANAFADEYPGAAGGMNLCPTEAPDERAGWPPLPGDYRVVRYGAPVAVCTLNDEQLVGRLADAAPEGLAIVGTMHTENLGIERVIKNTLANPHIRRLVLCGNDRSSGCATVSRRAGSSPYRWRSSVGSSWV